jgi:hypothetical protein
MSLPEFQRALSDLVASPATTRRVIDAGAAELADYDLTPLERRRLVAIVRHRGMAVNCSLYRANRLTPLARTLPATCATLAGEMGALLDEFFAGVVDCDLQWKGEGVRFAEFLRRHPRHADDTVLQELITYELAAAAARYSVVPL